MATISRLSTGSDPTSIDVVFVHGLWGNAEKSWEFVDTQSGSDYKQFWPKDLADDCSSAIVWSVGYDSSPTKWTGHNMPLLDRANSLLDLLDANEIGSRPIVFIAHSLGGLLVKAMLRASADTPASQDKAALHRNTKGVVFFSTPHTGSSLADLGRSIPGGRPTEILTELAKNDAYLRDLRQWFSDKGKELDYKCLTYFESYKTNNVTVVDAVSADPNHGLRPVPFDGDHYTICKIPDRSDQCYRQVLKMINRIIETNNQPPSETVDLESIPNVDFEIGVLPNPPQDGRVIEHHPASRTLSYVSRSSPGSIKIGPKMSYLDRFANANIIDPVAYFWNPFRCQFPSLDVVLINNTPKTLVLTGATLEVKSSKPDFSPVLVIPSNTWGMNLVIKNEGWGKITNAVLHCNLLPTGVQGYTPDPSIDHIEIGSTFSHTFELGDFAESATLNLRDAVGRIGVDVDAIDKAGFRHQTLFVMNAMQNGQNVKMAQHMGRFPNTETDKAWAPFPDGYVVVAGKIEFESVDKAGEPSNYSLPIRARVFLFNIRLDQPMPPSYQYSAELEHTGEDYEVPIKLCQSLKSGEADRLAIRIACAQSAVHKLIIRWNFAGGLSSRSFPIELHHFVPRTFAHEESDEVGSGGLDPELADVRTVFEGDCIEQSLMGVMSMMAATPRDTSADQ